MRDSDLANLFGRYLYADFCAGVLRSFIPALGGATDNKALTTTVDSPSSFAADPLSSEVYVTSLGGAVYRVEPVSP